MNALLSMTLIALSLAATGGEPPKRERLHQMFVAMRSDVPDDAPQLAVFERHLTDDDVRAITAFFKTPAGQHLAAATDEINRSAIADLEAAIARSKQKRTVADLRTLAVAVEAYAVDHDVYPATASLDHLSELLTPAYLRSMVRLDAWGKEYIYISDTQNDRVLSAGPDGRLSPDSQKLGIRQGDFGDDLIFENGEFVQPRIKPD